MKKYHINEIQFQADMGLAVSSPMDSDLLRFVFDCIASTLEGKEGSISKKEALRLSGIPKADTKGILFSGWKLSKPILSVHNVWATWLLVWFEIEDGVVLFGFYGPEDDPDGMNEFLNGPDRGFDLALIS